MKRSKKKRQQKDPPEVTEYNGLFSGWDPQTLLPDDEYRKYLIKSWKWRLRMMAFGILCTCTFLFCWPEYKIPRVADGFPLEKVFPFAVIFAIAFAVMPLSILLPLREVLSLEFTFHKDLIRPISFHLFGLSSCFLLGGVYGFAGGYRALSICDPSAFHSLATNGTLDRMSAFYFSTVTGATVGYGDIYPLSPIAKLLVTTQVLYMFFLIIFVLSFSLTLFLKNGEVRR